MADTPPTTNETNNTQTTVSVNPTPRFSKKTANQLTLKTFPTDLESKSKPFILIKIFRTGAGVSADDAGSRIVRGIGETVGTAVTSATEAVQENSIGAAAANALETGVDFLRNLAQARLGITLNTDRFKQSFKEYSLRRNTLELDGAIALMMPEGVTANYEHNYNELSMTAVLGGGGMIAQALIDKNGSTGEIPNEAIIETLSRGLLNKVPGINSSEEMINILQFGATGKTINPQLELLYNSPRLRTFTFDFTLVPRNAAEAAELDQILYILRYHAAPEIPEGTTGRYIIPPAQFQIEFYHKNSPNDYLFKTKNCVLETISIDYSPNGYATFTDGFPVQTRLQLSFRETSIMDKKSIQEEKNNSSGIDSNFISQDSKTST